MRGRAALHLHSFIAHILSPSTSHSLPDSANFMPQAPQRSLLGLRRALLADASVPFLAMADSRVQVMFPWGLFRRMGVARASILHRDWLALLFLLILMTFALSRGIDAVRLLFSWIAATAALTGRSRRWSVFVFPVVRGETLSSPPLRIRCSEQVLARGPINTA